jgi:purine nucleoside permease
MQFFSRSLLIVSTALMFTHNAMANASEPIEIKAVVVSMFEIGEDEGDKAGEFQLWKKGQKLTKRYPLPHGHHDIFVNQETGVLGIVTGMGIARASAAIMALGLDPRFDLSNAYWLVAGIAGMDPQDGTIGSAVWTDYVVDGDLAHQIDAREIPSDWTTGYFPLFAHSPYANAQNVDPDNAPNGEVYVLNHSLKDWAFALTKGITLPNNAAMDNLRKKYQGFPMAQQPARIMTGSHLSASTFWHGELLNNWANDWISYWTQQQGNFVTSGMEDSATLQALTYLDAAKLADKHRVLILRTASNFTMQPEGLTAAQNLEMESSGEGYAALQSAVEAAYLVGSVVIEDIIANWDEYKSTLPAPPLPQ